MKFHPILFSTEMVKAILEGRKTQTRRVIKSKSLLACLNNPAEKGFDGIESLCTYGKVGDVLWLRESFRYDVIQDRNGVFNDVYCYKTDFPDEHPKILSWKPSIHMPKTACRIFLQIKSIRVERLQDISEKDAIAEGVQFRKVIDQGLGYKVYGVTFDQQTSSPAFSFQTLWKYINGFDSWDANPFVWVIEFQRIERPNNFLQ